MAHSALAAAALGAGAVALACGGPADRSTPATAGLSHFNPFAHRVELDLVPYLRTLRGPPLGLGGGDSVARDLRAFYQHRGEQPAWFEDGRPRPEASQLIDFLGGLDAEGLDARDYRPRELGEALVAVSAGKGQLRPEEVEVGLSWAALLAASDLRYGRVQPAAVEARWLVARERVDLPPVLEQGLQSGHLVDTLRRLDPKRPQFTRLREALLRYRGIARAGGWPKVPTGPVLTVGKPADAARLRALAERLRAEGFLAEVPAAIAAAAPGSRVPYTPELAGAVRAFQATRTVEMDGSLGPETQQELNVPVWRRVRQIALNLERWRWVPDDLGPRAVVVNLPGYTLDVEEGGRTVTSMRVVVGEEGWETPVFSDRIRSVVLNPYWNVPAGIFQKEILPEVQRDPSYLYAHDMEVVDGEHDSSPVVSPSRVWEVAMNSNLRVRARPGEQNPLGKIKFMFPNEHDIYLHDTPAAALFDEPDRNASHGCIRVERPFELADLLFRGDPQWGGGRLRAAVDAGERREVPLPQPVPVYLLYFTAAVGPDGQVGFYEDIYDIDRAEAVAWRLEGSRRPGGAVPAPDEVAMQEEAGREAADVGPPGHTHGAAAWARRHRPGALHQLQRKPPQ